MAYNKDIKPWLKENGYTWEDMNKIWEECCEVNWKCKAIANCGKSWSDMEMFQIEQLPTLKEKTLAQIKEKEEAEQRKAEEENRKKEEAKYYEEHFEEIIVSKIDNRECLSDEELRRLTEYSIQRDYGENGRWNRAVYDVIELCERYFNLTWYEGLTEYQDNEFNEQPYEVFKKSKVVVNKIDVFERTKSNSGVVCDANTLLVEMSNLLDSPITDYLLSKFGNEDCTGFSLIKCK